MIGVPLRVVEEENGRELDPHHWVEEVALTRGHQHWGKPGPVHKVTVRDSEELNCVEINSARHGGKVLPAKIEDPYAPGLKAPGKSLTLGYFLLS